MRIGFVGLGKMGSQIVSKLMAAGHEVVVFDTNQAAVEACAKEGATPANSRENLVEQLGQSPVLWLMIPAQFVQAELDAYLQLLPANSLLIDGGNSNYEESIAHSKQSIDRAITFMDVGTSGGIMGLEHGFSLMIGGSESGFNSIKPILSTLASPSGGFMYAGPSGYGHYVKMIHNGIEYALMQAYAEGYELLKNGPLPHVKLPDVAQVWQSGSIVASTLNGLVADIVKANPELQDVDGYVAASGEGDWTWQTAQKAHIDMPALKVALDVRKMSETGTTSFATQLLAALRHAFGGHALNK